MKVNKIVKEPFCGKMCNVSFYDTVGYQHILFVLYSIYVLIWSML